MLCCPNVGTRPIRGQRNIIIYTGLATGRICDEFEEER